MLLNETQTQLQLQFSATTSSASSGIYAIDQLTVTGQLQPPTAAMWSTWRPATEWSAWGSWLPATCGVSQTQTRWRNRTRTCDSPRCGSTTVDCVGEDAETQTDSRGRSADLNCCDPADGIWTNWTLINATQWSSWMPAGCNVSQTRYQLQRYERNCTAPPCNGTGCVGSSQLVTNVSESRTAQENCCFVDGEWSAWAPSDWSLWSAFSPADCGFNQSRSRFRVLSRNCSNPAVACGGADCVGNATNTEISFDYRNATLNCCAVDGSWSAWTSGTWSAWGGFVPPTCGQAQTRQRLRDKSRSCTNPSPLCGGASCAGSEVGTDSQTETRSSAENCCSVDGGWSSWSPGVWSAWTAFVPANTCGVAQGRNRTRVNLRTCTSPAPSCGGQWCAGSAQQNETASDQRTAADNCCPVAGGWSAWVIGSWSAWSAYSPGGCNVTQVRQRALLWQRNCSAPSPQCGGPLCEGESEVIQLQTGTRAAEINCCPVDGQWSSWAGVSDWTAWSAWSPANICSGLQQRQRSRVQSRLCNGPAPFCGGQACAGSNTMNLTESMNRTVSGAIDGTWAAWQPATSWTAWSDFAPADTCSGSQRRERTRTLIRTCEGAVCGGALCPGSSSQVDTDTYVRNVSGPVDAAWSPWSATSEWSPWSLEGGASLNHSSCGEARNRSRSRMVSRDCIPAACGGQSSCPNTNTSQPTPTQNATQVDVNLLDSTETCTSDCRQDGGFGEWVAQVWSAWTGYDPTLCSVQQVRAWRRSRRKAMANAPCRHLIFSLSCPSISLSLLTSCSYRSFSPLFVVLPVKQQRQRSRTQSRSCDSPLPKCGGKTCAGDSTTAETDVETVELRLVPPVWSPWQWVGSWSSWQPWHTSIPPASDSAALNFSAISCPLPGARWRWLELARACVAANLSCSNATCEGRNSSLAVQWDLTTLSNSSQLPSDLISPSCCAVNGSWDENPGPWSSWMYTVNGRNSTEPACNVSVPQSRWRSRNITRSCRSILSDCGDLACQGSNAYVEVDQESNFVPPLTDVGWSNWTAGQWTAWRPAADQVCGASTRRLRSRTLERECRNAPPCSPPCTGNTTTSDDEIEVSLPSRLEEDLTKKNLVENVVM